MLNGRFSWAIPLFAVAVLAAPAMAGRHHRGGHACGGCELTAHCVQPCATECAPAPQPQVVTVMVPRMFTETQQITCTEYAPEQRTQTITVNRMVSETKPVQREYTEMVCQPRTRTENYTVTVPVWRQETRQCTVMVPQQEVRQATRTVCQWVPETIMQTVCRDAGRWEERPVQTACCDTGVQAHTACYGGGCGTACAQPLACAPAQAACAPAVCRVWVPNIVQEQVPTQVMRQQTVQQPYQYTCTVMRPQQQSYTVNVCDYRQEQRSRQVNYSEMVPVRRTFTENVTTCRWVPEQQQQQYTVMVPRQVQRQIQVQVCRMVPEQRTVQATCPTACHSGGCGGCW